MHTNDFSTVEEFLEEGASIHLIEELACDNDYWYSVMCFVYGNRSKKLAFLTDRQKNWLLKIKDDLMERQ